jgi:hypothetical protein
MLPAMRRIASFIVLALVLAACGGDGDPADPVELGVPEGRACSDALSLPSEGQDHIEVGQRTTFATDPPMSGPHWGPPGGPVPAGIHNQAFPDEATVHNLEHGHVIVHHNGLPPEVLEEIEAIVRADPVQMLVVSRPTMPWVLAVTAWTVAQVCDEVPDDLIEMLRTFVREHRDNAPESVP